MKLEFGTKVKVLLKLYEIRKGKNLTLKEMSNKVNVNLSYFPLKKWLLDEKILEIKKTDFIIRKIKSGQKRGFLEFYFVINYNRIDQMLCTELLTKKIYERILDGNIPVILPLKPKKEVVKR